MKKTDFKRMAQARGAVIVLLVIITIFGVLKPAIFLTLEGFINIGRQMAALTIISIRATMVMMVNEFSLSVDGTASLGDVMVALMVVVGISVGASFLLTTLVCMVTEWVNGYIVAKFRVFSLITTLGINTVLNDLIYRLTGRTTVFESIPKSFTRLGISKTGGIPFLSVFTALFVLAFVFLMKHMPLGRKMHAIGRGEKVSKIAGINMRTYKILAFTLCGALVEGMGIAVASRADSANASTGAGYFFQSYAAAYIDRMVSRQGVPNVMGTFAGAAILSILTNGLTVLQMPSYMQSITMGITIVVAVIIQKLG